MNSNSRSMKWSWSELFEYQSTQMEHFCVQWWMSIALETETEYWIQLSQTQIMISETGCSFHLSICFLYDSLHEQMWQHEIMWTTEERFISVGSLLVMKFWKPFHHPRNPRWPRRCLDREEFAIGLTSFSISIPPFVYLQLYRSFLNCQLNQHYRFTHFAKRKCKKR